MVVRGSDGSKVTAVPVFENQSALIVTHGMSSTESNKLKYEMEYTIEEVRCDGELVRMESVYTFTIPYPASTMERVDQTNDSDWTQLRFEGTNLVGARYRLTLETDDAVSPPHSTTVELSPSSLTSLSTWTAVLYPLTAPTLPYGRSYKVLSVVSVDGLHTPTITVGSFSTPAEPARIVSLVLSKYEDSMKTAVFSVTGRALIVARPSRTCSSSRTKAREAPSYHMRGNTVDESERRVHVGMGIDGYLDQVASIRHAVHSPQRENVLSVVRCRMPAEVRFEGDRVESQGNACLSRVRIVRINSIFSSTAFELSPSA
ncbi:hypothetical protein BLNAU_9596 [Blattamonas nauphoetae]|uniref:Uncharacterized protein n=1 Tax=Blattamonas nauphoetae TaxID=2049346 RepID=A0ABQ9XV62_9EUKA|nr:hypothetical protein BLNAU_9596 [Blattamonas nauphoetae]